MNLIPPEYGRIVSSVRETRQARDSDDPSPAEEMSEPPKAGQVQFRDAGRGEAHPPKEPT
jgi:hypothetical protein